jgi:hypothetical protein
MNMARRVGFKSAEHQGWIAAKVFRQKQSVGSAHTLPENPYPLMTLDHSAWLRGWSRFDAKENYKGEKL